ncbi:MAG: hypothetical protein ACI8ZN_001746 [Bacteroidia bacterium]|jgi:hypothetical protein
MIKKIHLSLFAALWLAFLVLQTTCALAKNDSLANLARICVSANGLYNGYVIGTSIQSEWLIKHLPNKALSSHWFTTGIAGYQDALSADDRDPSAYVQLGITHLLKRNANHFEMSYGFFIYDFSDPGIFPLAHLGYRRQKYDGRLMFRIGLGVP